MQGNKPTVQIRSQNKKIDKRGFWSELWRTRREPSVMLTLISTAIVTMATVGQLLISALQFEWTKKQSAADAITAEARDKRQLGAAEQLAAAASQANVLAYQSSAKSIQLGQRALDEATHTARTDQRAWVVPKGFTVQWKADGSAKFEWDLFNSGKTPAVAVRSWAEIRTMPTGVAPPAWQPAERQQIGTVIGSEAWTHVIQPAPAGMWADIHKKLNIVVYLRTLTCYRDVFGNEHWSKACLVQKADEPFAFCTTGNDVGSGQIPECHRN